MQNLPDKIQSILPALYGLAAYAVFSTHDVVVKYLGGTYSAVQIVFFSALMSFPIVTLIMMRDTRPGTLRPQHPGWVALRSISGTSSAACVFYALHEMPLSQVYAILFCAPLIITLLAIPILGEVVRLRRGIAILVGFSGVLVALNPGTTDFGIGHAAAFAGAFAGALSAVIVRKVGKEERSAVMILYPLMTNLLLMALFLPTVYVPVPLSHLGLFAVVALLVLLAMWLLLAAYKCGEAIIVAPMQYSQIIWAAIFGAILFDDWPDSATLAGIAIIAASSIYILRREAMEDVSKNAPMSRTRTRIGYTTGVRVGNLLRHGRGKE